VNEAARNEGGTGDTRRRGDARRWKDEHSGGGDSVGGRKMGGKPVRPWRKEVRQGQALGGGRGEARSERKGRAGGSDSGPVINEESNFQAGDLTSSRPNGGCYSMRDGEDDGG